MNAFELECVVAGLRDTRERWRSAQHRPRELGMRELPDCAQVAEVADAPSAVIQGCQECIGCGSKCCGTRRVRDGGRRAFADLSDGFRAMNSLGRASATGQFC